MSHNDQTFHPRTAQSAATAPFTPGGNTRRRQRQKATAGHARGHQCGAKTRGSRRGLRHFGKPTGGLAVERTNENDAVVKWDDDGRVRVGQSWLKKV
jgi:hypothetical protein